MSLCQKIRHCLPVLGLASLSLIYFAPAKAAPLCAQVLMRSLSQEEISATVASLATMRLNLDLAQLDGGSPLEVQVLEHQYPIKLADLNRRLNKHYSEKEIHELLVKEIAKQQERKKEDSAREKSIRKAHSISFPNYLLTKTISLPINTHPARIAFIPEKDVIIYEDVREGVVRKSISTGAETILAKKLDFWVLMQDRQTLLILQPDGKIEKMDIFSGQTKEVTKIGPSYFTLDTRGENLVTWLENESVQWVHQNLDSGHKSTIPFEKNYTPTPLTKDKVYVTAHEGAFVYDLNTGNKFTLRHENSILREFAPLSEDGQKFALYSRGGEFEYYDVNDLSKPYLSLREQMPDRHRVSDVQKIPGRPFFIAKDEKVESSYRIFDLANPHVDLFTFPIYGSINNPLNMIYQIKFSVDGNSIAVLNRSGETGYELHIWEQKE